MLSNFFKAYNELYPREEQKPVQVATPVETFVNTKDTASSPIVREVVKTEVDTDEVIEENGKGV